MAQLSAFMEGLPELPSARIVATSDVSMVVGELPELPSKPMITVSEIPPELDKHEKRVANHINGTISGFDVRRKECKHMLVWACGEDATCFWDSMAATMQSAINDIVTPEDVSCLVGSVLDGIEVGTFDISWGKMLFTLWLSRTLPDTCNMFWKGISECDDYSALCDLVRKCTREFPSENVTVKPSLLGKSKGCTPQFTARYPDESGAWNQAMSFICNPSQKHLIGRIFWLPCLLCLLFACNSRREILHESARTTYCTAHGWYHFLNGMNYCWIQCIGACTHMQRERRSMVLGIVEKWRMFSVSAGLAPPYFIKWHVSRLMLKRPNKVTNKVIKKRLPEKVIYVYS